MTKILLNSILLLCFSLSTYAQTVWDPIQNIGDVGDDAYVIASGDLDGDTFIDIVVGTYTSTADVVTWYKNDGTGNFTLQTDISNSPGLLSIGGLAIADLDGINGNDVIVGSFSGKVVWFANDGLGGFGSEQLIGNLAGAGLVTVADINNDNHLDVAAAGFAAGKTVWYAGDSNGNFGSEQIIQNVNEPGNVNFADFDGDGDLDVVLGFNDTTTDGTIEIYYNQYVESGTMTVSWVKDAVTVDNGNPFLFVSKFADVDDDGTLEIVKSDNSSGEVAYYDKVINGASTETMISDETIIDRPAVVAVADLDNDTYNDVVVTDGASADDALIWFESTDTGTFNSNALIADHNYQVFGITIADFDGDGDKDIASVGFFNGSVDWYENKLETLSIENNNLITFKMYPNPSSNSLNFKGIQDSTGISIHDMLGKNVLNSNVSDTNPLDISALNSGVYFIRFQEFNTTFKFIKN